MTKTKKVYRRAVWRRTAEILEAAPKLSKGEYARSAEGRKCSIYGDKAECYCIIGAHRRAVYEMTGRKSPEKLGTTDLAHMLIGGTPLHSNGTPLWEVNDLPDTTKEDMVKYAKRQAREATGYVEVVD